MRYEIFEGTANRPYNGEKQGWIQGDLDETIEFIEREFVRQYGPDVIVLALMPAIFAQDEDGDVFAVAVIG